MQNPDKMNWAVNSIKSFIVTELSQVIHTDPFKGIMDQLWHSSVTTTVFMSRYEWEVKFSLDWEFGMSCNSEN